MSPRRHPAAFDRLPEGTRLGLLYTLLRVTLFVLMLGLGILVGLHGLTLVLVAFAVSAVLSLPLIRRQREQIAQLTRDRINKRT